MRIAMVGLRGIPATQGGVERHVEELGARLAERGHTVDVYSRAHYTQHQGIYRGMNVILVPSPTAHGFEAFAHTAWVTLKLRPSDYDIIHFHALGPGMFSPISRIRSKAAIVQTIHGLDHKRGKWGPIARSLLGVGLEISTRVPDELVVVSRALEEFYSEAFDVKATYIANGAPKCVDFDPDALTKFGLIPQEYALWVGRVVPEKDLITLIHGWKSVDSNRLLVIVGDTNGSDSYSRSVRQYAASDPGIRCLGFQNGLELGNLFSGAAVFVQPSLLEGLPIALLEAIGHNSPVLVSDIEPHLEVVREKWRARSSFRAGDVGELTTKLNALLSQDRSEREGEARALAADVLPRYDWEVAADLVEDVYRRALAHQGSSRNVEDGSGNEVRVPGAATTRIERATDVQNQWDASRKARGPWITGRVRRDRLRSSRNQRAS